MSELATIARPYAKAAFDFAVEHQAIEQWTNLLTVAAQATEEQAVKQFLNVNLSKQKALDLFKTLCAESWNQYSENFIHLMIENHRLNALSAVLKQFLAYVAEYYSMAEVEVISAKPLSSEQQQKIANAMEKRLAQKIKLDCHVDESLIAGVIIKTEHFVIDGSSRGQLVRLAETLHV